MRKCIALITSSILVSVFAGQAHISAASDVTAPKVTLDLNFQPVVDVSCGDATVEFFWTAVDDLSPMLHTYLMARSVFAANHNSLTNKSKKISGDNLTWNMIGYITFPKTSASGDWEIQGKHTADTAMNFSSQESLGKISVVNNPTCQPAVIPQVSVRVKKSLTPDEVAIAGSFPSLRTFKTTLSISTKSKAICSIVKGKLRGLKSGNCITRVTRTTLGGAFDSKVTVKVKK